jgi:hypothetical protein
MVEQQPQNMPVENQLAIAQREFDSDITKLRSMTIVSFNLFETLTTQNFRRQKNLQLNDASKSILQEDYHRFDNAAFSLDNLAKNHSDIIAYDIHAQGAAIKGGWGKRYSFELILRTIENTQFGQDVQDTIINGYTYGATTTLQGTLDPNTEFIVDDVTIMNNGVFQDSFNVLSNPYGKDTITIDYEKMEVENKNAHLYSLRPSDISLQVAGNRLGGGQVTDNVIGTKPVESKSVHNNPLQGIGETLENISVAKNNSGEFDNPYDIATKSAIYSTEPSLIRNPFFGWLNREEWDKMSTFTLSDVSRLFTEIGRGGESYVNSMMKMIIAQDTNRSIFDADNNSGETILDTSAHMLIDAVQPLMKKFDIKEMFITISNQTIDGSSFVRVEDEKLIFKRPGKNAALVFTKLQSEILTYVFPLITKNRFGVSIGLLINSQGARVDISIDGFGRKTVAMAMYAYSTMSPVIGTYDEQVTAVNNVSTLSSQIVGI